MYFSRSALL
jgi:hypothetical protein